MGFMWSRLWYLPELLVSSFCMLFSSHIGLLFFTHTKYIHSLLSLWTALISGNYMIHDLTSFGSRLRCLCLKEMLLINFSKIDILVRYGRVTNIHKNLSGKQQHTSAGQRGIGWSRMWWGFAFFQGPDLSELASPCTTGSYLLHIFHVCILGMWHGIGAQWTYWPVKEWINVIEIKKIKRYPSD